jgi:hypothetical protein
MRELRRNVLIHLPSAKAVTITPQAANLITTEHHLAIGEKGTFHSAQFRMHAATKDITVGIVNFHPKSPITLIYLHEATRSQVIQ